MMRGPKATGRAGGAKPFALLLLPLVTLPLMTSCADNGERRDDCERPANCPDRRPLPILY